MPRMPIQAKSGRRRACCHDQNTNIAQPTGHPLLLGKNVIELRRDGTVYLMRVRIVGTMVAVPFLACLDADFDPPAIDATSETGVDPTELECLAGPIGDETRAKYQCSGSLFVELRAEGSTFLTRSENFGQGPDEPYPDAKVIGCCSEEVQFGVFENISSLCNTNDDCEAPQECRFIPEFQGRACSDRRLPVQDSCTLDCAETVCLAALKALEDNIESLSELNPVRRQGIRLGNWLAANFNQCITSFWQPGSGQEIQGVFVVPNSDDWPLFTDVEIEAQCEIFDWNLGEDGTVEACDGIRLNNDPFPFDIGDEIDPGEGAGPTGACCTQLAYAVPGSETIELQTACADVEACFAVGEEPNEACAALLCANGGETWLAPPTDPASLVVGCSGFAQTSLGDGLCTAGRYEGPLEELFYENGDQIRLSDELAGPIRVRVGGKTTDVAYEGKAVVRAEACFANECDIVLERLDVELAGSIEENFPYVVLSARAVLERPHRQRVRVTPLGLFDFDLSGVGLILEWSGRGRIDFSGAGHRTIPDGTILVGAVDGNPATGRDVVGLIGDLQATNGTGDGVLGWVRGESLVLRPSASISVSQDARCSTSPTGPVKRVTLSVPEAQPGETVRFRINQGEPESGDGVLETSLAPGLYSVDVARLTFDGRMTRAQETIHVRKGPGCK